MQFLLVTMLAFVPTLLVAGPEGLLPDNGGSRQIDSVQMDIAPENKVSSCVAAPGGQLQDRQGSGPMSWTREPPERRLINVVWDPLRRGQAFHLERVSVEYPTPARCAWPAGWSFHADASAFEVSPAAHGFS